MSKGLPVRERTAAWWLSSTIAHATAITQAHQAARGRTTPRATTKARNHNAVRMAYSVRCASFRMPACMASSWSGEAVGATNWIALIGARGGLPKPSPPLAAVEVADSTVMAEAIMPLNRI